MNYYHVFRHQLLFLFVLLFGISISGIANSANPLANLIATHGPSNKAPLFVYFDATGSTDADNTHPFHELTYCFDVDTSADPTATYSLANADSDFLDYQKDTFCGGPQFAYVYESAGTYTASVTAIDSDGNQNVTTVSITVSDYNSNETLCVAGSVFTDCPVGATQKTYGSAGYTSVNESIESALSGSSCNGGATQCKKVLFRAGELFSFTGSTNISVDGVYIGGFGTHTFFNGTTTNQFIATNNSTTACGNAKPQLFNISSDDVRIANMQFTDTCIGSANSNKQAALLTIQSNTSGDSDFILVQKVKAHNMNQILSNGSNSQGTYSDFVLPRNIGFFENEFTECANDPSGSAANCFYIGGLRLAFVGNLLSDSIGGEHVLRMWHVGEDAGPDNGGAFIFANKFELQSPQKSLLTIRAGGLFCAQAKNWGGDFWSEEAQVSNNYFIANGSPPVEFGGQNGCCTGGGNIRCGAGNTGLDQNKYRNNIAEGNYVRHRTDPNPDQPSGQGFVNLINLDGQSPLATYPSSFTGTGCSTSGPTCNTSNYTPGCCAEGLAIPVDQRFQFDSFSGRNNIGSWLGLPDSWTSGPSAGLFGGSALEQNGWPTQGTIWLQNNTVLAGNRSTVSENQSVIRTRCIPTNTFAENNVAYGPQGAGVYGPQGLQSPCQTNSNNFQKNTSSLSGVSQITTGCPYVSCASSNAINFRLSAVSPNNALVDAGTTSIKIDMEQHIRPHNTLWDVGAFEQSASPFDFGSGPAGPVCGNGIREGSEECDVGNTNGTEGCDPNCNIVENRLGVDTYRCDTTVSPNVCTLTQCSDRSPRPSCGVGCRD